MLTAKDLMRRDPLRLPALATVREACETLHNAATTCLPIVDERDLYVGMFRDIDVPKGAIARECTCGEQALEAPVGELARKWAMLGVDPLADLAEVVDLMLDHRLAVAPVVDDRGKLVGTITTFDVLRALSLDLGPDVLERARFMLHS